MHVFRDMYIRGAPDMLAAFAKVITDSLSGDWSRDTDAEERMRGMTLGGKGEVYCFRCKKRGRRPAATLFLTEKDKQTYYVANILPHEHHELSYIEYNDILDDFFRQFVQPAAVRLGVSAAMTEPEEELEDWVSPETAKKLRWFCQLANKSTGSSHPMDRDRWYDFIVSAHREGTNFDASTLARWLQEAGGWDDAWSYKLAVEYEFARGLLAHADAQAVGV